MPFIEWRRILLFVSKYQVLLTIDGGYSVNVRSSLPIKTVLVVAVRTCSRLQGFHIFCMKNSGAREFRTWRFHRITRCHSRPWPVLLRVLCTIFFACCAWYYIFLLFTYLPFISPKLMSHLLRLAAWPTESKFYVRVRIAGQISLILFLPWYDLEHLKRNFTKFYNYARKGNVCKSRSITRIQISFTKIPFKIFRIKN